MKRYSPSLCEDAEKLYSESKYSECLQVALDAHEKATKDARKEWEELLKGAPSELAKLTKMWDTTSQKYLTYDDYIKSHNWKDDIPPAPLRIATKALRKQAKGSIQNRDNASARRFFEEIENIGQLTESDKKIIDKITL